MSQDLPNDLALTSIADGSAVVASPLRNNFADVQTDVNALVAALSGGAPGQVLTAVDSNTVTYGYPPGYEVVAYTTGVDFGPTGVTGTGNGDALFSFAAATFEAVKYYFELSGLVQDNGGSADYEIRLHDGTAPGTLIASAQFLTPGSNPGQPVFVRFGFTPTAGSHTFQVRLRDVTGGRTYTIGNSNYPLTARIVKA